MKINLSERGCILNDPQKYTRMHTCVSVCRAEYFTATMAKRIQSHASISVINFSTLLVYVYKGAHAYGESVSKKL